MTNYRLKSCEVYKIVCDIYKCRINFRNKNLEEKLKEVIERLRKKRNMYIKIEATNKI